MKIKYFFILISSLFLFYSCSNNGNRELKDYVSAFIHENQSIVFFGKTDLNSILNKAAYKSIPMIGSRIEDELKSMDQCIGVKTPIYFAVEGPFSTNAIPEAFYGFIDVKNADSLVSNITKKGYDFEKEGDMSYTSFGELTLGVKNNLAILISKSKNGEIKDVLEKAFEMANGDVSEGKMAEILEAKGDLVLGVNIESMYSTSDTQLAKLKDSKKKELKEMVSGSYTQTTVKFENGAAIIQTKNYFSEALKKRLFLKSNSKADIVGKLGHGNATLGFSMNFDMDKFQQLINDFAPEALAELSDKFGMSGGLMLLGENPLVGVSNGQLGFVMVGDLKGEQMTPDFNAYIGLNKNGKSLAEIMTNQFLTGGNMILNITNKEFCCYSSSAFTPLTGQKLSIPVGCENFGKKAITGFINLDGKDLSSFDFEGGAKIINIIKYINFEVDEEGSLIYIKSKKGKENILKESLDFLIKELMN